ncbi:MAG: acyl carrier protein [Verrucomicrobiota bacterium]
MTSAEKLQALQHDVDFFVGATEHTPLATLPNWGSLAVLLVILHCETKYDLVVTGPQVRGCKTVGDLLKLLP